PVLFAIFHHLLSLPSFFFIHYPPPFSTLFPYTTLFRSFFGSLRYTHEEVHHVHESPPSMLVLLAILAILSIVGDYVGVPGITAEDRKSTRLNSSHVSISYAVFCLKKKNKN